MDDSTEIRVRHHLTQYSEGVHADLAFIVILVAAYVLANSILNGQLAGNDSLLHVSYSARRNKYFPSIPYWYPLQGGGASHLHSYPFHPHLPPAAEFLG